MRAFMMAGSALLLVAAAGWFLVQDTPDGRRALSPEETEALIAYDSSVVVLDVRTPGEYRSETGHLPGALLIPLQELGARWGELEPYRDRTIVVYCRTQNRSGTAIRLLQKHGFKAHLMQGGITRWNAEGRPVVHEEQQ